MLLSVICFVMYGVVRYGNKMQAVQGLKAGMEEKHVLIGSVSEKLYLYGHYTAGNRNEFLGVNVLYNGKDTSQGVNIVIGPEPGHTFFGSYALTKDSCK
jgi:hypothetical protein